MTNMPDFRVGHSKSHDCENLVNVTQNNGLPGMVTAIERNANQNVTVFKVSIVFYFIKLYL